MESCIRWGVTVVMVVTVRGRGTGRDEGMGVTGGGGGGGVVVGGDRESCPVITKWLTCRIRRSWYPILAATLNRHPCLSPSVPFRISLFSSLSLISASFLLPLSNHLVSSFIYTSTTLTSSILISRDSHSRLAFTLLVHVLPLLIRTGITSDLRLSKHRGR